MARPDLPAGPYLIVGIARSGQAIARALVARGERVIAVDAGSPRLEPLPGEVEVLLGDDGLAALERARTVVKSPGVPAQAAVVARALADTDRWTVLGELELAWRLVDAPVLAVTGTNGKTTTATLVHHVLGAAGQAAALVGNVGTAYSSLALTASPPPLIVCEASSFQLEDATAFAPEGAVLLNLDSDHLDRHGTLDAYHAAKLRIFAAQAPGSVAVFPDTLDPSRIGGDAERVTFGRGAGAQMRITADELVWRGEPLLALAELGVPGPHNHENAAAAAALLLARGTDRDCVVAGLRTFAGVAHRLERVAEPGGVTWVNDSKATNVAAALTALRSFPGRRLHVILGGSGKGEDFTPLAAALASASASVYLIGDEAGRLADAIADAVPVVVAGTLAAAVEAARVAARPGEVVVLAPACASFDQFESFEQRGEVFSALARTPT